MIAQPARGLKRWLLLALAVTSLAVGAAGLVIPGLPTTEFVLLAAWAAARSSPQLHAWIAGHRLFGPLLEHWQRGRLPRKAKWAATCTMGLAALAMPLGISHRPSLAIGLACMAAVLLWLWLRPEPEER
ncbi:YbaN family protein [Thauera linaloolentis]|uniref:Inner membrane protein n=1 Tax=Thauera linaloolentis (strain DSM 12138 / JCM 21573 / CCUG 41526 / CIP 105981 / IAM 15112 / NBRC 102519 / 47Lol) TaxID=1123367 RepID=N6Z7W6_THAL4|nr:YbaN family protein [Thauera linaloolentis]ENO90692.1 hypothetical protein C666_00660 [Thauera linaloolentis 47Lol = DSM 12138]MCM8565600.1 YbaN family protein [Thauera linaloolentis]